MTQKHTKMIILGIMVINIVVVIVIKNWDEIYHNVILRRAYYCLPTQEVVERKGHEIAALLNEGKLEAVLADLDPKAALYFMNGVTNWLSSEDIERIVNLSRTQFKDVKRCEYKKCLYVEKTGWHVVQYTVTLNDGTQKGANARIFQGKRGHIGIASINTDEVPTLFIPDKR